MQHSASVPSIQISPDRSPPLPPGAQPAFNHGPHAKRINTSEIILDGYSPHGSDGAGTPVSASASVPDESDENVSPKRSTWFHKARRSEDSSSSARFHLRQRSNSRSRAEFIEEGVGPDDANTPEDRAMQLVSTDKDILSASTRARSSTYVGPQGLDASDLERARRAIDSDPAYRKNHSEASSMSSSAALRDPSSSPKKSRHSESALESELLPPNFNPNTHPLEDLLRVAIALHTSSKSSPMTKPRRLHSGTKFDSRRTEEADARLTLSTKLFGVLADRGSIEGTLMYGLALRAGWGVPPDPAKGVQVLQDAVAECLAEHNSSQGSDSKEHARSILRTALYELGNSYLHGTGEERDIDKGLYFLEAAAAFGDADAMESLGDAYMSGICTHNSKQDKFHAAKWYRAAEEAGKPPLVGMSWIHKDKYDPNPDGTVKAKKHFWQK